MPTTQLVKDSAAQEIPNVPKWDPTLTEPGVVAVDAHVAR